MFAIDFTKPYLYKDVIYFHQGNLSTNNTLRCSLNTGGSNDLTGCSILCTFKTQNSTEISGVGRIVDPLNAIVDLVFPSNALVVGTNKLEILVNRVDGSVAQSPSISYDIWQGLTTGNGVEAETNYPILIELINSVNEASNQANATLDRVNAMQTDVTDAIDNAYRSANSADIATSNANTKIEEVETSKLEMIKKVDNSIANMKVETTNAINNVTTKTDEKIADVDRALAAGTVDLELKKARKDANGVVHDTLEQRLESDLIVGDKSLKDFVVDMNGMKETQDLAYETNSGYKVCNDTQVGVIKNLKLSGKSLVNVTYGDLPKQGSCNFESIIATATNRELKVTKEGSCVILRNGVFKRDTEYTIIAKVKYISDIKDLSFSFYNRANNSFVISMTTIKKANNTDYATYIMKLNTWNYDVDAIVIGYHGGLTVDSILGVKDVLVLEGDYTQNAPSHFEGIASVGNEIEVLSRKENGNLVDINNSSYSIGEKQWYINGAKICVDNIIKDYETSLFYYVNVQKGKEHTLFSEDLNCGILLYNGIVKGHDQQKHIWSLTPTIKEKKFTPIEDIITIRVSAETYRGNLFVDKLMLNVGNKKPYEIFKGDKKAILFKDTDEQWKPVTELRGIDLTACDTIEKHSDSKHYLHVRTEKLILNGSEDWKRHTINDTTNTDRYALDNNYLLPNSVGICNVLPYTIDGGSDDKTCIYVHGTANRIDIRKLKSDNRWTDVPSLKLWLQSNNVILICIRKQEKVYEVNPLELESFDNITLWLILSGVIAPPASFKITSSLPGLVKSIQDQVRQLQDQVYKTNVANFTVALNTLDTKLRLDRLEAPKQ